MTEYSGVIIAERRDAAFESGWGRGQSEVSITIFSQSIEFYELIPPSLRDRDKGPRPCCARASASSSAVDKLPKTTPENCLFLES